MKLLELFFYFDPWKQSQMNTDIEYWSKTSYTTPTPPPCNRVIGHGVLIGGIQVLANHICGNTNKVCHDIHAHMCASVMCWHVACFMLWAMLMQVTCACDKSQLVWWQGKPEYPELKLHAWKKMASMSGIAHLYQYKWMTSTANLWWIHRYTWEIPDLLYCPV